MRIKPKRIKYNKQFKGGSGIKDSRGICMEQRKRGEHGLMAAESGRLTARQREAGRRTLRQTRNRRGKVWRKVYPAVPVTKKPREVRMGKGKGTVEFWAVHVRPGKRRYEVAGVERKRARVALTKVGKKRPVRTKRVCSLGEESSSN
jgi:large subunit ribosomal protein L16